eukprot:504753_1
MLNTFTQPIPLLIIISSIIQNSISQLCGSDCSNCNKAPTSSSSCNSDTTNRCIYNFALSLCEVDQCGPDCSLCNTDLNACDADPLCFYLVNANYCELSNTCASDCVKCLSQQECENTGDG